jgi:hypothetical protein
MPSLYVLSRTGAYGAMRVALALTGLVLSGAWLLDRTSLIASDPFDAVTNALVAHPLTVAAALAATALVARSLPGGVKPVRPSLDAELSRRTRRTRRPRRPVQPQADRR